jgi:hypothetical protein
MHFRALRALHAPAVAPTALSTAESDGAMAFYSVSLASLQLPLHQATNVLLTEFIALHPCPQLHDAAHQASETLRDDALLARVSFRIQ